MTESSRAWFETVLDQVPDRYWSEWSAAQRGDGNAETAVQALIDSGWLTPAQAAEQARSRYGPDYDAGRQQ